MGRDIRHSTDMRGGGQPSARMSNPSHHTHPHPHPYGHVKYDLSAAYTFRRGSSGQYKLEQFPRSVSREEGDGSETVLQAGAMGMEGAGDGESYSNNGNNHNAYNHVHNVHGSNHVAFNGGGNHLVEDNGANASSEPFHPNHATPLYSRSMNTSSSDPSSYSQPHQHHHQHHHHHQQPNQQQSMDYSPAPMDASMNNTLSTDPHPQQPSHSHHRFRVRDMTKSAILSCLNKASRLVGIRNKYHHPGPRQDATLASSHEGDGCNAMSNNVHPGQGSPSPSSQPHSLPEYPSLSHDTFNNLDSFSGTWENDSHARMLHAQHQPSQQQYQQYQQQSTHAQPSESYSPMLDYNNNQQHYPVSDNYDTPMNLLMDPSLFNTNDKLLSDTINSSTGIPPYPAAGEGQYAQEEKKKNYIENSDMNIRSNDGHNNCFQLVSNSNDMSDQTSHPAVTRILESIIQQQQQQQQQEQQQQQQQGNSSYHTESSENVSFPSSSPIPHNTLSHNTNSPFNFTVGTEKESMTNQFRSHFGDNVFERPRICPHPRCGKVFSHSANLRRHMRSHTGLRPYTCGYGGCPKRFARRSDLITHVRTHTGERPYRCQECTKSFTTCSNLRRHEKTHRRQGSSKQISKSQI